MGLFEKKVPVYRKRDKETWEKIRKALDDAGIRYSSSHYEQEEIPVGGYSAMDPRNYGKNGRVDREVYVINVKESALEEAGSAIRNAGIAAVVKTPQELTSEAREKIRNRKY